MTATPEPETPDPKTPAPDTPERKLTGWVGTVLNAPDARALAYFYRDLFGWALAADEPRWCTIGIPGAPANLAFQAEDVYERPTWPAQAGEQQMMFHLDIGVTDVDGAVADALALGAELHPHQPQEDVRVLLDPAGHPFCLYLDIG
ncbi:MAG: VOC family protein [Mycobacteriales bacterium]